MKCQSCGSQILRGPTDVLLEGKVLEVVCLMCWNMLVIARWRWAAWMGEKFPPVEGACVDDI